MLTLQDKICIVTGAAQGIGKAISLKLLKEGAIVIGLDLTQGSMESLKNEFQHFHPFYLDITNTKKSKDLFISIKKEFGKIDVLVNNAGVIFNRKIGMITRDEMEIMFNVNVIALIELTQLAVRIMGRQGEGSIVNIASVTALQGSPGQSAYSATKGAIISFTNSAAKEIAPLGIRINAVAPGIVKTERFKELYETSGDKIDNRINRIALGRLAEPEDIAKAVCFLASNDSSYITGQILTVDGCSSI